MSTHNICFGGILISPPKYMLWRSTEALLMSTHNICFLRRNKKNINMLFFFKIKSLVQSDGLEVYISYRCVNMYRCANVMFRIWSKDIIVWRVSFITNSVIVLEILNDFAAIKSS